MVLAFLPKPWSLWITTAVFSLLQLVNAQTTITPSLTVDIDIDSDGQITVTQTGRVILPDVDSGDSRNSVGFPFFLALRDATTEGVGATAVGKLDLYRLSEGTQFSFDCLMENIGTETPELNDDFTSAIFSSSAAGLILFVPEGYNGEDITGSTTTVESGLTLADAGFNEGGTCFVEYDIVDGDDANDVRIEWRVIGAPSSSPSESQAPSSEPSSSPSSSPSTTPSAQPSLSNAPTFCFSRSTKSPGKGKGGKGRKMRKTTKTAAPTGCLETKSPGKGMMMMGGGKGMMMRGNNRRGGKGM